METELLEDRVVVRTGGADDHLELGVGLPETGERFDAVPTWRRAHKYVLFRPCATVYYFVVRFR
jgi:hypothetical protein